MLRKNIFSSRGFHVLNNNQRSTRGFIEDPSRTINVQPSTMSEDSAVFNEDVPTTCSTDDNNQNNDATNTEPTTMNADKQYLPADKLRKRIAKTIKKRRKNPKKIKISRTKVSTHIYPSTLKAIGIKKSKYKKVQIYDKFKDKSDPHDVAKLIHTLHLKEHRIKKPVKESKTLVKHLVECLQSGTGDYSKYIDAFKTIYPVISTVLKVTQPELMPFLIAGDGATEFM